MIAPDGQSISLGDLADLTKPLPSALTAPGGERALQGLARREGEAAIPALVRLLGEPTLATAAIEALGTIRSAAAAEAIAPLSQSSDRSLRKHARQALHRLKSVGITPASAPAAPPRDEHKILAALMTQFDGTATQLIQLFVRGILGATREVTIANNAWVGVAQVASRDLRGTLDKRLEELHQNTTQSSSLIWTDIPVDYALGIIRRAMTRNTESTTSIPPEMGQLSGLLPPMDSVAEPMIYQFVRPIELKLDPSYLDHSDTILDEPELDSWRFAPELITQFTQEVKRAASSPLMVGGQSGQELVGRILMQVHFELLTPGIRKGYALMLEESALMFWLSGRQLAAKRAAAAAAKLTESDHSDSPFSRRLIAKSVLDEGEDASPPEQQRPSGLWVPG